MTNRTNRIAAYLPLCEQEQQLDHRENNHPGVTVTNVPRLPEPDIIDRIYTAVIYGSAFAFWTIVFKWMVYGGWPL